MAHDVWLDFQDISTPVHVSGCSELLPVIANILDSWCFRELSSAPTQHSQPICLSTSSEGYTLNSRWLDGQVCRHDPVDLVCALIIELVWAYLDDHPEDLCLHGAAAEFAGRLIVFPNQYRAGKSLLTGCLASAGHRIFTDDILPVRAMGKDAVISGLATGVASRLRLPLPGNLPEEIVNFLDSNAGPQSQRYRYLDLPENLHAPRNEARPIGAFVMLERQDGAIPALEPIGEAEMLRHVVWQNFARNMPSGAILHTLQSLVGSVGRYRLLYDTPAQAIELLTAQFATWAEPAATLPAFSPQSRSKTPTSAFEPAICTCGQKSLRFTQRPGVFEHAADGQHFLADADGVAIHHLNETAATIWNMLAEPMQLHQIVELFQAAFPDQPANQVTEDITGLVDGLAAKNLLRPIGPEHNAVDIK